MDFPQKLFRIIIAGRATLPIRYCPTFTYPSLPRIPPTGYNESFSVAGTKDGELYTLTVHSAIGYGSLAYGIITDIILQSFLICSASLVGSVIYVYMQFFPIPLSLIYIAKLCWMMGNGLPVYVYLTINRTIQKEVLIMFGLKDWRLKTVPRITQSSHGATA